MLDPDGCLGVEEAARLCGVSDETIRRRLRANRLPHAARAEGPSSPWRIPFSDLIADGLEPQGSGDDEAVISEVTRLREALEASERLLAERQSRIEDLQAHLTDVRALFSSREVTS
jgi:excisionase family DNA binding protein